MERAERGKQFLPFAALRGFEEAVKERERETQERIFLGEDAQAELDMRLQRLHRGDEICVEYYSDRQYIRYAGRVNKISAAERRIEIGDRKIPIADITSIGGAEE